jgi:hypothetical protein
MLRWSRQKPHQCRTEHHEIGRGVVSVTRVSDLDILDIAPVGFQLLDYLPGCAINDMVFGVYACITKST